MRVPPGMVKDEHFDLLMHEDGALAELAGGTIVERTTFHHWPLSNVQRVTLADGRKYIYKAQSGPMVEGTFYRNAKSPLLVPSRVLYESDGYLCMLFDLVEGTQLNALKLSEVDTLSTARELTRQIGAIEGDLPSVFDIRGPAKWGSFVGETIGMLDRLVEDGRFVATDGAAVKRIESLANAEPVLAAVSGPSAYVHGDFPGENVLKLPDGWRIIDWTRPFWGPADLDCMNAVASAGYNPLHQFNRGLAMVEAFLRINWSAQCKFSWIREGECYDEWVVGFPQHMIRCSEGTWKPWYP